MTPSNDCAVAPPCCKGAAIGADGHNLLQLTLHLGTITSRICKNRREREKRACGCDSCLFLSPSTSNQTNKQTNNDNNNTFGSPSGHRSVHAKRSKSLIRPANSHHLRHFRTTSPIMALRIVDRPRDERYGKAKTRDREREEREKRERETRREGEGEERKRGKRESRK